MEITVIHKTIPHTDYFSRQNLENVCIVHGTAICWWDILVQAILGQLHSTWTEMPITQLSIEIIILKRSLTSNCDVTFTVLISLVHNQLHLFLFKGWHKKKIRICDLP